MKNGKLIVAGLALVLAFGFGTAQAANIDLNEVAAFLVFPGVVAGVHGPGLLTPDVETFITVTNNSGSSVFAHANFIDEDTCGECDWTFPLTPNDTDVIVMVKDTINNVTHFTNLDTGQTITCNHELGFLTVNIEDASGNAVNDNYLYGEEIVVDYANGAAASVGAISVQGANFNDGDRNFAFDGNEYRSFPSVVAADFIAPTWPNGPVYASLILFTLAFQRRQEPLTDCDVAGYDATEGVISGGFQFGCWAVTSLQDISPEFAYPFLGPAGNQDHGWLNLKCTVDGTGLNGTVFGGVHGAIAQYVEGGGVIRRAVPPPNVPVGPAMANADAWARLLYQSVTPGDPMTLSMF